MAREDLARDFDHGYRSSLRSTGATAGTIVRPGAAASAGSSLHGIVSVPAGVSTPVRTSADVRSSTDFARPGFAGESEHDDFTSEFEYSFDCFAGAGGQYGV